MSHATVAVAPNADVIDAMHQRWRADPDSVEEGWRQFFEGFELGTARRASGPDEDALRQIGITRLIFAYRDLGHRLANLDPLNAPPCSEPLLELAEFDLSPEDLMRTVETAPFVGLGRAPLGTLVQALKDTYCRSIGVEFMHLQDIKIREWLQARMEPVRNAPGYDSARRIRLLEDLSRAEGLEKFIQKAYQGHKRFSLEGGEALIPALEAIVERSPDLGIREVVLGMAHRGRLNVLAHTLHKPYEEIFAQFEEGYLPETDEGDGDVKYHLGASADRVTSKGGRVHVSLTPNPSHLEAVNPVVEGRVRAKQARFKDTERRWGLPVLIHGDAAFAGQGLVAETLNLSQLEGYTTGGTLHIITNNQIGFTTSPIDARSSLYCTDVAKMIQAPVFHVNGDDPEAVVFATELALEFRQQWRRDVVVDVICYRRWGHNETDEPAFTQPVMYKKIRGRPTLGVLYAKALVDAGVLSADEAEAIMARFLEKLEGIKKGVKAGPRSYPMMRGHEGAWKGLHHNYSHAPADTGAKEEVLRQVAEGLTRVPDGFDANQKVLDTVLRKWQEAVNTGGTVNWGGAETLAFGSLLLEKVPVRLSGQDCRRGTFSHRHAALYDTDTGARYVPLSHLSPDQAPFEVYDSLLSEAAVLGFEYGYSLDMPNALVMWEAQFGDFVNGAQVIIDQFIASSESKWQRDSGLVMLLPHGYEGQGPEHSSARLERFLQLCAEDNMQVCVPTVPAQFFHLLRRQVGRKFRKPLVVLTPKSLLRLPECASPVADLTKGHFREVLDDAVEPASIKRVVLCSGKLYYDLAKARKDKGLTGIALVRLEQLYPFPEAQLLETLRRYPSSATLVWAQEESQNNGAWSFVEPRLRQMGRETRCVARDASSSPATGSLAVHTREQTELVEAALAGDVPHLVRATSFRASGTVTPATHQPEAQPKGKIPTAGGAAG
ncbi:MAG: 2-oxoglutarate dehydrogenase E1 component [Gemmataceae bacterium]|nr:2-oxoglutarate dehydrogenase E1 component [Gemmataceae bacterium]